MAISLTEYPESVEPRGVMGLEKLRTISPPLLHPEGLAETDIRLSLSA